MNNEEKATARQDLVDSNSLGFKLVQHLEELRKGGEKPSKLNKKTMTATVKVNDEDLNFLSDLAKTFEVSRNYILQMLVQNDIKTMFSNISSDNVEIDQAILADGVDSAISEKGFKHEYRGKTWYWDTVQRDPDFGNPERAKGLLEI